MTALSHDDYLSDTNAMLINHSYSVVATDHNPSAITESFIMSEWTHKGAHALSTSANAFNHQHHRS